MRAGCPLLKRLTRLSGQLADACLELEQETTDGTHIGGERQAPDAGQQHHALTLGRKSHTSKPAYASNKRQPAYKNAVRA